MRVGSKRITKYGLALLAIVFIGLFLRVYQLGTQSIWLDEAWSVWMSQMSLPQIVATVPNADVQPPLYYFVLHYWMMVFGTSESAVRLLSALLGVLAIPVIYVVGRQLFDEEAGLVAALLLAISWFNIWHSQETRMYSLMVLLALLSMYFFLRFVRQGSLASSAGYVFATTLLIYTHYYGFFVVIAQNIYVATLLLLSKNRTYRLSHWVALQAIILALFIPWMAAFIKQTLLREAALSPVKPSPTVIVSTFYSYAGTGYSGTTVLLALFLGLSVLSLFTYQKVRGAMDWKAPLKALESYSWEVRLQDPSPVYFLAVWLIGITLIPFVLSQFSPPIYDQRYTIAASVALYLLVAKGIRNINHRYAKLAVIGVIVVLAAANLQMYYTSIINPQAREATSLIDANFKNGDVVLVTPSWQFVAFNYYNNRTDVIVKPIHSRPTTVVPAELWAASSSNRPEDKIKEIQSAVNGHDRVWWFTQSLTGEKAPETFTLNVLNESYAKSYVKSYNGYDVYLFEKRA